MEWNASWTRPRDVVRAHPLAIARGQIDFLVDSSSQEHMIVYICHPSGTVGCQVAEVDFPV